MKKFDKFLKGALSFCAYTLLFFVLQNASINNLLYPFAFGMLFALAWANQKVYLLIPAYLISGLAINFSFENAISLLTTSLFLIVPYYIHVLCKKVMKKWEFGLFALLSQTAFLVFSILENNSILLSAVNIILGVLYMFLAIVIFEALVVRGFTGKLTTLEFVALFVLVLSLCSGLVGVKIGEFSLLKLFVSLIILIFAHTSTSILTLLCAITAGLGALFATNNPIFVTPFAIGRYALWFSKTITKFLWWWECFWANRWRGYIFNSIRHSALWRFCHLLSPRQCFYFYPTNFSANFRQFSTSQRIGWQ